MDAGTWVWLCLASPSNPSNGPRHLVLEFAPGIEAALAVEDDGASCVVPRFVEPGHGNPDRLAEQLADLFFGHFPVQTSPSGVVFLRWRSGILGLRGCGRG